MNELWKPVPGYEGKYEISNMGRVKSLDYHMTGKEHIMKPVKKRNGYLQINLCKKCKYQHLSIHRLVWETFVGPVPDGLQINHLDEDKTNNRLDNLCLMTPRENSNYGTRNMRISKAKSKTD